MLAVLFLIACQDPTEVVVFLDAAPELRTAQNALHIEVQPLLVDGERDPVEMEGGAASMPTSVTLVPRTADEPRFRFTAEIRDADGVALARSRILTRFVTGESRALFVMLSPGGTDCTLRETWDGTACVGACVDEPEEPRAFDRPTPTRRCDATCADAEDGELCMVDGTPGRCWSQTCCTGCWDGEACVAGDVASACGAGGAECEACATDPPCSDECVGRQCVPAERFGVAAGGVAHTCASGEALYCWGRNTDGQVGTGTVEPTAPITRVRATGVFEIAAGLEHTCVIDWNRDLLCWGGNGSGQLGDGTTDPRLAPPAAPTFSLAGWLEVSTSWATTCAIREEEGARAIYCWGQNAEHQAGLPGPVGGSVVTTPGRVGAIGNWLDVASGHKHGAAVGGEGTLWTWGGMAMTGGTVGPHADSATIVPPPMDSGYEPRDASSGREWVSVAAERFGTCAIDSEGALYCSGQHKGEVIPEQPLVDKWPLELVDRGPAVFVSDGFNHVCWIEEDHSLHCAGVNFQGQLGVEDSAARRTRIGPVGATWSHISAGYNHTCAIRASGALYCWGLNDEGQIGPGPSEVRTPQRVCIPPP